RIKGGERETMTATETSMENLTLNISQEIQVRASIENAFAALLEQLGPANEKPDGEPMPMVLEPRPGGRWFRDLGGDNGHFWGNVQAIKRPTLLEITGPLFVSGAVISNVQYRLKEVDGGTLISFRHSSLGYASEAYREGVGKGWTYILEQV